MWSSSSNFIKHLSYTLSSRCFHILSRHPVPQSSPPFPCFFRNHRAPKLNRFAVNFSSETSQTDSSFVSPYLSVHVRCHKHAAVSFFLFFLSIYSSSLKRLYLGLSSFSLFHCWENYIVYISTQKSRGRGYPFWVKK